MSDIAEKQVMKHECTSCSPGWFLGEDGGGGWPAPDCVCPMLTNFAGHLYWSLPESRRAAFAGIEAALCGTRTHNHDELARRLVVIFSAYRRCVGKGHGIAMADANLKWNNPGGGLWDVADYQEFLNEVHSHRWHDRKFAAWANAEAEEYLCLLDSAGPVGAWLALDELCDLLVSCSDGGMWQTTQSKPTLRAE